MPAAALDPLGITFPRSVLVRLGAAYGAWVRHPPRAWDQRLAGAALIAASIFGVLSYALLLLKGCGASPAPEPPAPATKPPGSR